jgi:hypothetical protein
VLLDVQHRRPGDPGGRLEDPAGHALPIGRGQDAIECDTGRASELLEVPLEDAEPLAQAVRGKPAGAGDTHLQEGVGRGVRRSSYARAGISVAFAPQMSVDRAEALGERVGELANHPGALGVDRMGEPQPCELALCGRASGARDEHPCERPERGLD